MKAKRLPLNLRKVTQWTLQHLKDTGLLIDFISPRFAPEEEAEAKYMAQAISAQFTAKPNAVKELGQAAADEKAARLRHLVIVILYRMLVQGTLNFYQAKLQGTLAPPPGEPLTPLGPKDLSATAANEQPLAPSNDAAALPQTSKEDNKNEIL